MSVCRGKNSCRCGAGISAVWSETAFGRLRGKAPWREEGRGGPVPQAGGGNGTDAGKGRRSEAIRPYPMKKEVTIRS